MTCLPCKTRTVTLLVVETKGRNGSDKDTGEVKSSQVVNRSLVKETRPVDETRFTFGTEVLE